MAGRGNWVYKSFSNLYTYVVDFTTTWIPKHECVSMHTHTIITRQKWCYVRNPSTQETEAGELDVLGWSELQSELEVNLGYLVRCFKKKELKKNKHSQ